MSTFDGKSEKLELFEDLFQTSFKNSQSAYRRKQNKLLLLFHVWDALQTFKVITSLNRVNLGDILTVFRRKCVKPPCTPTAEHNIQRLIFNAAKQKVMAFLNEL